MGRKKMPAGQKVDIRLRIDSKLQQRIQAMAEQQGNTVTSYIRSAAIQKLVQDEKEAKS